MTPTKLLIGQILILFAIVILGVLGGDPMGRREGNGSAR